MNQTRLDILLEDNHCLAVNKPAGMLTMGDDTGDVTVADLARDYLRVKYAKPGNVFLGVVHRLDRPVSGTLLFARTSKAASRLSDQFRRSAVRKTYLALVEGRMQDRDGELVDWVHKDTTRNHVSVVDRNSRGARECRLTYRVIEAGGTSSLVEVRPLTGRSHQIRVQLAHCGHPIVGDLKYGARDALGQRIMLHATSLEFRHPTQKTELTVESCLPDGFHV